MIDCECGHKVWSHRNWLHVCQMPRCKCFKYSCFKYSTTTSEKGLIVNQEADKSPVSKEEAKAWLDAHEYKHLAEVVDEARRWESENPDDELHWILHDM